MRDPVVHKLKVYPKYYREAISGMKKFEVRIADRDYQVGDVLCLAEYNAGVDLLGNLVDDYTGRAVFAMVTSILDEEEVKRFIAGVNGQYVVMSIELMPFFTDHDNAVEMAKALEAKCLTMTRLMEATADMYKFIGRAGFEDEEDLRYASDILDDWRDLYEAVPQVLKRYVFKQRGWLDA